MQFLGLFKRLTETLQQSESLRLEVMTGILELLREPCGGSIRFVELLSTWLHKYATFSQGDEGRNLQRLLLTMMLRAKLLTSADIDKYLAAAMNGGSNVLWVEIALKFVGQCLADNLAATYEFNRVFDTVSRMKPSPDPNFMRIRIRIDASPTRPHLYTFRP